MNTACTTCGTFHDISWTELHGYQFEVYPNDLFVVTNAAQHEFDKAVEVVRQSHDEGHIKNIDDVLREWGFMAVCGENSNHKVPINDMFEDNLSHKKLNTFEIKNNIKSL